MINKDIENLYENVIRGIIVCIYASSYGPFEKVLVNLKPGDRGSDVLEVQRKMKEKGYYPGNLDGIYGEGMKQYVIKFRKDNNLKECHNSNKEFYEQLEIIWVDWIYLIRYPIITSSATADDAALFFLLSLLLLLPLPLFCVELEFLDYCSTVKYCCWDAIVSNKQPMPTRKFPRTFISSEFLPFASDIAIAFVKIKESSGVKFSKPVMNYTY